MIQVSLEEGDGWLHKYTKDEQKQSATICSDLVIKGLPSGFTNNDVRRLFKECGKINKIIMGKEGKHTATIHFEDDDGRAKALLMHNSNVIGAGKALSSFTITTIGDDKLDSREILMSNPEVLLHYQQFFSDLTEAEKSPLKPTLAKLKLKSDRWAAILSFPLLPKS